MIVALTGTPGCGKTSAVEILRNRGHETITVEELARKFDAISGDEVDIDLLVKEIELDSDELIIEGHLSHNLTNHLAIVLRCDPRVLKERLARRGYPDEKIRQNMEAEAIDLILVEALDMNEKVYEIDTTNSSPEKNAEDISAIISGRTKDFKTGRIDWSQVVLEWY